MLSYPGLFKNIPYVWFSLYSLFSLIKNLQHDFPKMRGGGSMAVWNFSENLSVFDGLPFPNRAMYPRGWGQNKSLGSEPKQAHSTALVRVAVNNL